MIVRKAGTPLFIVLILLSFASIAAATPFDVNLIVNPGAEMDVGGSWGSNKRPSGWTVVNNFEVVRYNVGGSYDLNTADSAAIGGGNNYFGGGYSPVSSASQTIDISDLAVQVDAGLVSADLSGYLGGWVSQGDNMIVEAVFLDQYTLEIGPVFALERDNESKLIYKSDSGIIPTGTRAVEVTMTATRVAGSYNDGYADNLSFVLHGEPEPVPEPATMLLLGSGLMGLAGFRGRIRKR